MRAQARVWFEQQHGGSADLAHHVHLFSILQVGRSRRLSRACAPCAWRAGLQPVVSVWGRARCSAGCAGSRGWHVVLRCLPVHQGSTPPSVPPPSAVNASVCTMCAPGTCSPSVRPTCLFRGRPPACRRLRCLGGTGCGPLLQLRSPRHAQPPFVPLPSPRPWRSPSPRRAYPAAPAPLPTRGARSTARTALRARSRPRVRLAVWWRRGWWPGQAAEHAR